jgi:hypothetical protein
MAKYQRNTLTVEASPSGKVQDLGELGNLISSDIIIRTLAGNLYTMACTAFHSKFSIVNEGAALEGEDTLL